MIRNLNQSVVTCTLNPAALTVWTISPVFSHGMSVVDTTQFIVLSAFRIFLIQPHRWVCHYSVVQFLDGQVKTISYGDITQCLTRRNWKKKNRNLNRSRRLWDWLVGPFFHWLDLSCSDRRQLTVCVSVNKGRISVNLRRPIINVLGYTAVFHVVGLCWPRSVL